MLFVTSIVNSVNVTSLVAFMADLDRTVLSYYTSLYCLKKSIVDFENTGLLYKCISHFSFEIESNQIFPSEHSLGGTLRSFGIGNNE